jgi:hypothetical protein
MSRRNQRDVILDVLQRARGQEVPLPAILSLRISQFGARIKELRAEGHIIRNRIEHRDGQVFSWYRLESSPDDPKEQLAPTKMSFPQFGALAKETEYPG